MTVMMGHKYLCNIHLQYLFNGQYFKGGNRLKL